METKQDKTIEQELNEKAKEMVKPKQSPEEIKAEVEKKRQDALELDKLRKEEEKRMREYVAARKNFLRKQLELLRLEHEYVKLQVETHHYSEKLNELNMRHKEMMEQVEKEQAKEKPVDQPKEKKVVKMEKEKVK